MSLQDCTTQREALLDIYDENGGSSWTGASLWATDSDYCTWEGVTCNGAEDVIGLDLSGFGLTGTLSSSISCLTFLKSLYLNTESFTGEIPEELCQLTHLQYFQANNSGLTGSIPTCVCTMSQLKYFYAANNSLTGSIPDCVSEMTFLIEMHLTCNEITGTVPEGFDSLEFLTELRIECNDGLDCTSALSSKSDFIYLCGTDFDYCDECVSIPNSTCPESVMVGDCGPYYQVTQTILRSQQKSKMSQVKKETKTPQRQQKKQKSKQSIKNKKLSRK